MNGNFLTTRSPSNNLSWNLECEWTGRFCVRKKNSFPFFPSHLSHNFPSFCVTIDFSTLWDFLLDCAVAIFLFQCVLSLPCASQCDVRDGSQHSKGVRVRDSRRCVIWLCMCDTDDTEGCKSFHKFLEKPFPSLFLLS